MSTNPSSLRLANGHPDQAGAGAKREADGELAADSASKKFNSLDVSLDLPPELQTALITVIKEIGEIVNSPLATGVGAVLGSAVSALGVVGGWFTGSTTTAAVKTPTQVVKERVLVILSSENYQKLEKSEKYLGYAHYILSSPKRESHILTVENVVACLKNNPDLIKPQWHAKFEGYKAELQDLHSGKGEITPVKQEIISFCEKRGFEKDATLARLLKHETLVSFSEELVALVKESKPV